MPICIAGMHRSGTSMIARMLNLCGLYLGEEGDLHEAQADNPEGFWEHKRFQDINDKILRLYGGAWDAPPKLHKGWENDPQLAEIREEASRLVAEFEGHEHWGWKDPRNSLLLPFWQAVIPDLKVLVTLRNPLDVAASLTKRGYASQMFGVSLWNAYADSLEADLSPSATLWTHYASYFDEADQEIERVTAFCGLPITGDQLEAACATVAGGLRHSETTILDLLDSPAPTETVKRYFDECIRCGPVYQRLMRNQAKRLAGLEREKEVRKKDEKIIQLEWLVNHRESEIKTLNATQLKSASRIVALERDAGHLGAALAELNQIKSDPTWPLSRRLGKSRLVRALVRAAGKWKREGFMSLMRAGTRRLAGSSQTPSSMTESQTSAEPPHAAPVRDVSVLEILKLDPTPLSREDLAGMIQKRLDGRAFALAISHDSFQAFTGGIQTLINDEMETLRKDGVAQIHACPVARINCLSEDAVHLEIIVSLDGQTLGVAEVSDLTEVLIRLQDCRSVQVHHTMNWNLSLLSRVLEATQTLAKYFWIHDYYSVCESYNLLRNDRAFCNAPPLDSNSCSICRYGPTRAAHMAAFKDLFQRWNFEFIVPSKRGADIWLHAYPEYAARLKVLPIYSLEPTGRQNARQSPEQRPIRVAFPGISYEWKGWSQWRKLVDTLQYNPNYELIHLGQKVGEIQHTAFPERFKRVRSGPANPHALPEAFEEEKVDIIFYCPIWPETFSLIAYEANATGCWTLSTQDSGNVAAYVEEARSGKVFPSVDTLITYLLEPEVVREDLTNFKAQVPLLSRLRYNEKIVEQTYLNHK